MSKSKKILYGVLYWLVELTWGAVMTIPGFIITLFCMAFLHGKPRKNGFSYIVEVGGNWGGLELGGVAIMGKYSEISPEWGEYTRRHEFGHSLQNIMFGPLYIFIVGIPSAYRYWLSMLDKKHQEKYTNDWYYSIWFEKTASDWGTAMVDKIES